jgi:hypothetical protein
MAKKIIYKIDVQTDDASKDLQNLDNQLDDIQSKSKIDIAIDNANSVKSIGDLRKAYKELQNAQIEFGEGTDEFKRASEAAGQLKDKLDATKESVKSFSASPIENVANSFADLKNKVVALDFGGIKQSFSNLSTSVIALGQSMLGLGTASSVASVGVSLLAVALAATGITLIVGAVALLVTQFDDLGQSGGSIAKVFNLVGDAVKYVKDAVVNLADAWGLVDKNATTASQEQIKAAEATTARLRALRTGLIKDDEQREKTEAFNRLQADQKIAKSEEERYLLKLKYFKEIADITAKYDAEEKTALDKKNADYKKAQEDKNKLAAAAAAEAVKIAEEEAKAKTKLAEEEAKAKTKLAEEEALAKKNAFELAKNEAQQIRDINISLIEDEKTRRIAEAKARAADAMAKTDNNELLVALQTQLNDQLSDINQEFENKEKQRRIDAFTSTADAISNLFTVFSSEGPMGAAAANFASFLADTSSNLFAMIEEGSATTMEYVGAGLQAAQGLVGSIGGLLQAQSESNLSNIQTEEAEKVAALQRQADAGVITAEQLAKGVETINKKARAAELKEKKKAFEQNKAIQIVQAVIGTAQGIVAASANAFPLNIVMMALAAAVGAANIGIIASQQFPSGGGGGGGGSAPSAPAAPALPGSGSSTGPNISFAAAGSGSNLNTVGGGAPQPIIIENNVSISETQVTNAQTTVAGQQAGSELGGG